MEELKEEAKEEIKKGIAEALEELGAELKGGDKEVEKLDREVKEGPNPRNILNMLHAGAKGRELEKDEEDTEGETKEEVESAGETEDESSGGKDLKEEEKEDEKVDDEIPISEPPIPDIEDVKIEDGVKEEEEEEEEKDEEIVDDILERLRKGLSYSYRDRRNEEEQFDYSRRGTEKTPEPKPRERSQAPAPQPPAPGSPSKEDEGGSDVESYVFENATLDEGTSLPDTSWEGSASVDLGKDEDEEELTQIDEYYSLVPKNPEPDEDIYAYAHITWDDDKNSLVYRVTEPELSKKDEELLKKIREGIEERLDVDFESLGKIKARGYIGRKMDDVLEILGEEISGTRKKAIRYYLERDFVDMGKIEPLMRDPNIEEISCDGVGIPIFVYHRNAKYGSLETNIVFEDEEKLDQYVMRLGQKVGKTVSMSKPLVDASLPDGSRLQATLGTDIARKGSNFTIRKFTENPLTPTDLIEFETVDPRVLAYLWLAIENQNSVLISGGTATGKTTMLNVISLFIKPEMKIVTIEDTAELRLPHNHWVPEVAREAMSEEDSDTVDMFDLLKESLRQRPDYIVVGEVRGAEAFVLFQQMSTGHPGLATIHAENPERLISRLTTKPIDLPPSLLSALDIVIFLRKVRRGDSLMRKIDQIVEVKRFSREENVPKMNRVFKWDPKKDKLVNENPSLILNEISELKGMDSEDLKMEIKDRERVIEWMVHEGIRNLDTIGEILSKYYSEKESLLEKIEA